MPIVPISHGTAKSAKSNNQGSSFFSSDGFLARVSIEVVGLGLLGISLLSNAGWGTRESNSEALATHDVKHQIDMIRR